MDSPSLALPELQAPCSARIPHAEKRVTEYDQYGTIDYSTRIPCYPAAEVHITVHVQLLITLTEPTHCYLDAVPWLISLLPWLGRWLEASIGIGHLAFAEQHQRKQSSASALSLLSLVGCVNARTNKP